MTNTNRLKGEISPYLLQHANNPVAWFPWKEEAFSEARKRDKPIFLSIGYSTCHWCHVMAHECFEDEEIADLMNDAFISIKVDREELPHIDAIYMNACQIMTGSGGWPLTIIMTPEKRPLFAATYLPKYSRQGLIGLMDLIPRIDSIWKEKRKEVLDSAETIAHMVADVLAQEGGGVAGEHLLHDTFNALAKRFSPEYGGFGHAPKFPMPHTIMFLLRYYKRSGDGRALAMAEKTLSSMSMGGIYDHIGYGFHRYSTDGRWLVPHFEKMLYDQALLTISYTEAFQATGKNQYRQTAEEILQYVLRDMVSPDGFFFSAEDADSEGREGKFYLWKDRELRSILDRDDYLLAARAFSVCEAGNFTSQEGQGENIIHLSETPSRIAASLGIDEDSLLKRLAQIRYLLFEKRDIRARPFKDDKALTDWNGLMIAALAKACQAFGRPEYLHAAKKAAGFVLDTMVSPEGSLFHMFREGSPRGAATANDYACLIWGFIELYTSSFNPLYLEHAVALTNTCIEHYLDSEGGGFFLTSDEAEVVIARTKESYDSALPSSNSVLALNLARLAKITGDTLFEQTAHRITAAFAQRLVQVPDAHTFMMAGLDFLLGPTHEVVISGDPERSDTQEMLHAMRYRFLPNVSVMLRTDEDVGTLLGHVKDKESIGGRATAYVCTDRSCREPTTDVQVMLDFLSGESETPCGGE